MAVLQVPYTTSRHRTGQWRNQGLIKIRFKIDFYEIGKLRNALDQKFVELGQSGESGV